MGIGHDVNTYLLDRGLQRPRQRRICRAGRRERLAAQANFPLSEPGSDFILRLWAARQIGHLTRQIRLEGASRSLVSQVRDLGLRYGILTEYTSYLVREPDLASPGAPVPLREEQMGGAGNAARQTGTQAFERAQASAKFSDVKTLAATDQAASEQLSTLEPARVPGSRTRRIGGRLFVQRSRVWTDVGHTGRITITAVAAYSRAYFDLVRQLPEVAPYLSAGEEILIAGRAGEHSHRPGRHQSLGTGTTGRPGP